MLRMIYKSTLNVPTPPAACGGTGSSVKRSKNWSHPILSIGRGRQTTTTPTRVPNTTLQQTSSPDITTVSNTLCNRSSWTTQHALSSDHLPIIITINIDITTDYNKTDRHSPTTRKLTGHNSRKTQNPLLLRPPYPPIYTLPT